MSRKTQYSFNLRNKAACFSPLPEYTVSDLIRPSLECQDYCFCRTKLPQATLLGAGFVVRSRVVQVVSNPHLYETRQLIFACKETGHWVLYCKSRSPAQPSRQTIPRAGPSGKPCSIPGRVRRLSPSLKRAERFRGTPSLL
jgi:hypothetical protein